MKFWLNVLFTSIIGVLWSTQAQAAGRSADFFVGALSVFYGVGTASGDTTIPSRSMSSTGVNVFAGFLIGSLRLGGFGEYEGLTQSTALSTEITQNLSGGKTSYGFAIQPEGRGSWSWELSYRVKSSYLVSTKSSTGESISFSDGSGYGAKLIWRFAESHGLFIFAHMDSYGAEIQGPATTYFSSKKFQSLQGGAGLMLSGWP